MEVGWGRRETNRQNQCSLRQGQRFLLPVLTTTPKWARMNGPERKTKRLWSRMETPGRLDIRVNVFY